MSDTDGTVWMQFRKGLIGASAVVTVGLCINAVAMWSNTQSFMAGQQHINDQNTETLRKLEASEQNGQVQTAELKQQTQDLQEQLRLVEARQK